MLAPFDIYLFLALPGFSWLLALPGFSWQRSSCLCHSCVLIRGLKVIKLNCSLCMASIGPWTWKLGEAGDIWWGSWGKLAWMLGLPGSSWPCWLLLAPFSSCSPCGSPFGVPGSHGSPLILDPQIVQAAGAQESQEDPGGPRSC